MLLLNDGYMLLLLTGNQSNIEWFLGKGPGESTSYHYFRRNGLPGKTLSGTLNIKKLISIDQVLYFISVVVAVVNIILSQEAPVLYYNPLEELEYMLIDTKYLFWIIL